MPRFTVTADPDPLQRHTLETALAPVIAAAIPPRPPAQWFSDPGLSTPTPLTITSDGRVYGTWADSWDQCHVGIPGECVTPAELGTTIATTLGRFSVSAVAADGAEVRAPSIPLVIAGGHPSVHMGRDPAIAYYDDTRSAIADVAVGPGAVPWFSGALRPGVTEEQIRVALASAVSGDWRPSPDGTERHYIALLSVNSPGFPLFPAAASGAEPCCASCAAKPVTAGNDLATTVAALTKRIEQMEALMAPEMDKAKKAARARLKGKAA